MSFWELNACLDGYLAAHGEDPGPKPPTEDEHLDMLARFG